MRRLWIVAALLSLSSSAFADGGHYGGGRSDGGWNRGGGYNHTISRHSLSYRYWSGYYGDTWGLMPNNARVLHVPQDMNFNDNPDWGKGCRSCADVSK